ncbi:MAG: DNA polymerase III subunit delta' [Burkholderiaceae bacterium]
MVDRDGRSPLPWLDAPLRQALSTQQAHALLIHGPQGVGQFELALALAQGWLCEDASATARPCGSCAACRLVQAHSHPDLLVLLPEALREPLGWGAPGGENDGAGDKPGKAKPSKDIKVEAVRAAVAFAQTTSARGRGKVVVLHPAERMNSVAANTLLKTLEEPPGNARFALASAAADVLLPTIRSRCQSLALGLPPTALAVAWLAEQHVKEPAVMLAATGGQPQEALAWSEQGIDAHLWERLPRLVTRGEASAFAAWPLARVIDALQKLCHDSACVALGAAPRYFPTGAIKSDAKLDALLRWMGELNRSARHAEHPWHAALMLEALVQRGRRALDPPPAPHPVSRGVSVHSRA